MRSAVTKLIILLGRYAMLPLIVVAAAVFMAWFVALHDYPRAALISLPIALPIATAAIALALGLLLPIRHLTDGTPVDEELLAGNSHDCCAVVFEGRASPSIIAHEAGPARGTSGPS